MNGYLKRWLVVAALAAIAILGWAPSADAGFQVTLKAGVSSKTISDGGAGDADGVVNGEIGVVSETVGGYTFKFTLTTSNTPGGGIAFVNQGTNEITGSGATTIEIVASANDFTAPVTPPDLLAISGVTAQFLSTTVNGNTADISYSAYVDTANALSISGVGTVIGSGGPTTITAPGGNVNLSDSELITSLSAKYALNLVLTAVLNNGGTNRIDLDGTLEITPTPAPAGLVLAIAGLPILGGFGWLRRRKVALA